MSSLLPNITNNNHQKELNFVGKVKRKFFGREDLEMLRKAQQMSPNKEKINR